MDSLSTERPPARADRRWVALVAAVVLAPILWVIAARGSALSDGTTTYPNAPAWSAAGAVIDEVVGPGALLVGDRVVAVDGKPLDDLVTGPRDLVVGQPLRYSVLRGGEPTEVEVVVSRYALTARVAAHVTALPLVVLMVAVASFVFLQRPRDRAARALFVTAAVFPWGTTAFPLGAQVIDLIDGPQLWAFMIGDIANAMAWGALLHFTLVFPLGRPPVRRWLVPAAYALPFVLHAGYLGATLPSATSALERWGRIAPVSITAGKVVPFLVVVAVVIAYRNAADADARLRLRMVIFAVCGIAVLYAGLGQIPNAITGRPIVPWDWQPLLWAPFPLILGAAVMRYGLFEIRVIIRRSLVYGSLTIALVAIYIGIILLLTDVVDSPASISALLATAAVAVLFQPLREWLRRRVSQLVFGARDDPYTVMTQLGQQLQVRASPDAILADIVAMLARTLRLPYVGIDVLGGDEPIALTSTGRPSGAEVAVELRHRGELIGTLVLDPGPAREPFGPADQPLLEAIARQVAAAAHDVLLTARLRRSLGQVVTAREEERRRLRRDIHDGIGPTLAAGSMRLEVARAALHGDPHRADEHLAALAEIQLSVIADLRRLVDGLRPPALDQLGLAGALREQVGSLPTDGSPIHVEIDCPADIEPLPAAVEVAAYHVIREAMANVIRHSGATECLVRLHRDGSTLLVEVVDNGCGLPATHRAGVGLNSIRERAIELGGAADIATGDAGTTVSARLPLPGQ